MNKRDVVLVFAILSIIAALGSEKNAISAVTEVVDQSVYYPPGATTYYHTINNLADIAQTFTVGVSGVLSRIELELYKEVGATQDMYVDIRKTSSNGYPLEADSPVLGQVYLSAEMIPPHMWWPDFTVKNTSIDLKEFGIQVYQGDVLAIVLHSAEAPSSTYYWRSCPQGAQSYNRGAEFYRMDGDIWRTQTGYASYDQIFKTYVIVPEPSTLALLGMGGIGMIAYGWRRRKAHQIVVCFLALLVSTAGMASADTFGTGANQFTLDFVPISGATNPASGIPAGDGFTFTGVNYDYRMGTYEITNDQWNKFVASYGEVTGSYWGYRFSFYDCGTGTTTVPTNETSWYEAAQFVNWLNTSTGHQAAYKFTGTRGKGNYTFVDWSVGDAGYDASNPYRNQNAYYFLPNENEWVKAAYWNGTSLQTYSTKAGESLTQGHGTGTGWNYYYNGYATNPYGPWTVGSGSQELNGTYDMMGNIWEWMESPYIDATFVADAPRGARGGRWFGGLSDALNSSFRYYSYPTDEYAYMGFRVASVPEPGSLAMLLSIAVGGLLWWRRKA